MMTARWRAPGVLSYAVWTTASVPFTNDETASGSVMSHRSQFAARSGRDDVRRVARTVCPLVEQVSDHRSAELAASAGNYRCGPCQMRDVSRPLPQSIRGSPRHSHGMAIQN